MRWVAIAVSIAADPAVHRVAEALRVRVPEAVGLLALTFAGMAQHAPDGRVGDVPNTLLESWSGWHGKRGAFAAQFRAELCDEAGVVRAWDRWNGANIRKAERAIDRTRRWREEQERLAIERVRNADVTANGTRNVTHNERHNVRPGTEQDRTVPRTVQQKEGSASAPPRAPRAPLPAWVPRLRTRWEGIVGPVRPTNIHRGLGAAVDAHGEELVLAAMDAYVEKQAAAGKDCVLRWFAEGIVRWVERAKESDAPIVEDGWMTAAGERATRPEVAR